MDEKLSMQQVGADIVRFMRGNYALDELPFPTLDCLKFRQGKKTILSINIHPERYEFQIIFGKAERAKFEERRAEFPAALQEIYDAAHTYHDGKWMLIPVETRTMLDAVKQMLLIKKRPNRKPFPKENAIISSCGHRCDLCVHYIDAAMDDAQRAAAKESIQRVYKLNPEEDFAPCKGCANGGITGNFDCEQILCAKTKAVPHCRDCPAYDCEKATAGLHPRIALQAISAADVTWAILPFVPHQYGN